MNSHQRRRRADFSHHEGHRFFRSAVEFTAKAENTEFTPASGQCRRGNLLYGLRAHSDIIRVYRYPHDRGKPLLACQLRIPRILVPRIELEIDGRKSIGALSPGTRYQSSREDVPGRRSAIPPVLRLHADLSPKVAGSIPYDNNVGCTQRRAQFCKGYLLSGPMCLLATVYLKQQFADLSAAGSAGRSTFCTVCRTSLPSPCSSYRTADLREP